MYPYLAPSLAFFVPGSVVYQIVFGGGVSYSDEFLVSVKEAGKQAPYSINTTHARVPSIMYFLRLARNLFYKG